MRIMQHVDAPGDAPSSLSLSPKQEETEAFTLWKPATLQHGPRGPSVQWMEHHVTPSRMNKERERCKQYEPDQSMRIERRKAWRSEENGDMPIPLLHTEEICQCHMAGCMVTPGFDACVPMTQNPANMRPHMCSRFRADHMVNCAKHSNPQLHHEHCKLEGQEEGGEQMCRVDPPGSGVACVPNRNDWVPLRLKVGVAASQWSPAYTYSDTDDQVGEPQISDQVGTEHLNLGYIVGTVKSATNNAVHHVKITVNDVDKFIPRSEFTRSTQQQVHHSKKGQPRSITKWILPATYFPSTSALPPVDEARGS